MFVLGAFRDAMLARRLFLNANRRSTHVQRRRTREFFRSRKHCCAIHAPFIRAQRRGERSASPARSYRSSSSMPRRAPGECYLFLNGPGNATCRYRIAAVPKRRSVARGLKIGHQESTQVGGGNDGLPTSHGGAQRTCTRTHASSSVPADGVLLRCR